MRDFLFVKRSPGVPDDAVCDILVHDVHVQFVQLTVQHINSGIRLGFGMGRIFHVSMDKGVMGQGVRFFDFYHYLCHQ